MQAHRLAARLFTVPAALRSSAVGSIQPQSALVRNVAEYGYGPAARARCVRALAATSQAAAAPPMPPFHLAFPVNDLSAARDFYGRVLGCSEGRSADRWQDYSLFGHQLVCHLVESYSAESSANGVDGDPVPVPHFGLALGVDDFHALAARVEQEGIRFIIQPHIRFEGYFANAAGQPGEQWTMFFKDPSGNSLEFKAMTSPENLFAKYHVTS